MEKIVTKPSQKEITAADLTEYLNKESDFAFEIRAIKELQKAGDVLHGGTYMDAITGKPRQFDIRVMISKDRCMIRLAVEWGAIAPVPRISTKSGPFSPGEWLESLPGSARGY